MFNNELSFNFIIFRFQIFISLTMYKNVSNVDIEHYLKSHNSHSLLQNASIIEIL